MEHSLDNGDGPPCLQVKLCTPEFYQAHYQLVSLHYFKKRGRKWETSCSSEPVRKSPCWLIPSVAFPFYLVWLKKNSRGWIWGVVCFWDKDCCLGYVLKCLMSLRGLWSNWPPPSRPIGCSLSLVAWHWCWVMCTSLERKTWNFALEGMWTTVLWSPSSSFWAIMSMFYMTRLHRYLQLKRLVCESGGLYFGLGAFVPLGPAGCFSLTLFAASYNLVKRSRISQSPGHWCLKVAVLLWSSIVQGWVPTFMCSEAWLLVTQEVMRHRDPPK